MKIRNIRTMALVLVLIVSIIGCSPAKPESAKKEEAPVKTETAASGEKSGDTAQKEDKSENPKKDSYTFGYIAYDMTDIWNEYSARAFEYAASKADVEVKTVILDSKNSLEESVTAMESLIQQGVDGISIFPISTEQGAQLVKMANEANIPVTVENFVLKEKADGDFIACVACEYDNIGYEAIKYIATNKPGAKVFFCAGQRGAGVYEKYQEGIDRALEDFKGKVEIVATLHGDWATDKSYNVTTDFISSGKEFDYIFANSGLMAQGCYQALKDASMENIPIVSTGGSPDDYKMLQDGIESANMTAPVSIQGVQTFKNLYEVVVENKTPEKFVSLPILPVSNDKLEDFIAWDDYDAAYSYVYKK